jgi:hypothetical protein
LVALFSTYKISYCQALPRADNLTIRIFIKELNVIGKVIAIGTILALTPMAMASADEVEGEAIVIPAEKAAPAPEPAAPAQPVTAYMPASVEMLSTSVGLGLGISWGEGTLSMEGETFDFAVKGLGLGDLGYAQINAFGDVSNLENATDIAGTYVAVEAGAAGGSGAGVMSMRNEHGVVITMKSDRSGVQLALGADAFLIKLK